MGASAPPCGTSRLVRTRTLPLKAGPVSFKRLLGGAVNRAYRDRATRRQPPARLLAITALKRFSSARFLMAWPSRT